MRSKLYYCILGISKVRFVNKKYHTDKLYVYFFQRVRCSAVLLELMPKNFYCVFFRNLSFVKYGTKKKIPAHEITVHLHLLKVVLHCKHANEFCGKVQFLSRRKAEIIWTIWHHFWIAEKTWVSHHRHHYGKHIFTSKVIFELIFKFSFVLNTQNWLSTSNFSRLCISLFR